MFDAVKVVRGSNLQVWLRAALPDYRKQKVYVCDRPTVMLDGGYWDGGSRSSWMHYTITGGRLAPLDYPTAPPQFGGKPAPQFEIPVGTIVVCGGVTNGNPATVTLYGNPQDIAVLLGTQA